MIAIAALFATSAQADEAYVKMSGDWYNHGTAVKLPVYPPVQCTNFLATPAEAGAAECPKIVTPAVGTTHNKNTRGFRADGATVRVQVPPAGDGLTPGAPFTIPGPATLGGDAAAVPGDNGAAFVDVAPTAGQPARTVAVPLNIKVQQLNTRLSWRGPVRQRSEFINGGLFQGQNRIFQITTLAEGGPDRIRQGKSDCLGGIDSFGCHLAHEAGDGTGQQEGKEEKKCSSPKIPDWLVYPRCLSVSCLHRSFGSREAPSHLSRATTRECKRERSVYAVNGVRFLSRRIRSARTSNSSVPNPAMMRRKEFVMRSRKSPGAVTGRRPR